MLFDIPGLNAVKLSANEEFKIQTANTRLQVGELLKAVVVSSSTDKQLHLSINGQTVKAKAPHTFLKGEILEVKVAELGKETVLQILNRNISNEIINQALRQVLPNQVAPKNFLNTIKQILDLPQEQLNQLPKEVVSQLKQLVSNLPSSQQLSSTRGLKEAIQNSGTFLENKFNQQAQNPEQKPSVGQDLKAQFLKLFDKISYYLQPKKTTTDKTTTTLKQNGLTKGQAAKLPALLDTKLLPTNTKNQKDTQTTSPQKNTITQDKINQYQPQSGLKHTSLPLKGAVPQPVKMPPLLPLPLDDPKQLLEGLKEQANQALSRIQAHQLNSMPKENVPNPTFTMDLPVKVGEKVEVIPLMIEEQESHQEETEQNIWSISLALDLENLGEMQIKASLFNKQISIQIWSKLAETQALLQQKDYLLQDELKTSAVPIAKLEYHLGAKENNIDRGDEHLLDINI